MLTVRARSCHRLSVLRRSPRQIGLCLRSTREIQGGLLVPTAAVSCLPAWRSPTQSSEGTGASIINVGDQVVEGNASVREKLSRVFRRFIKALEILLRAVRIGLLFSPVVVSGSVVGVIQRLGVFPEAQSTTLCDWWWKFLLKVVDQSGPTFIKAAQWASTRQDSFPKEVCSRLSKLHTFTRRKPVSLGKRALDEAFGPSWRPFLALEDEPLGSGCVASVYKGRIIAGENAGRQIAVKVLHPDVQKAVQLDLAFMRGAATVAEMLPFLHLQWLSLSESVDEFASLMEMQMDLRREAANLERFIKDFENDATVVFPQPIYPWVAANVLVENFLRGEPVSNFFPSKKLARMGLQAFLHMVFITNFVHGDLHPGNVMVGQRDNGEPRLLILDAGIVCELDENDRENFCDLFYAVAVGDGKRAGSLMIERARHQQCTDPQGFCEGVDDLVQMARSKGLRLGQIQAGELLARMSRLCLKHEVKLESKFARLLIAIAVLEGVGRSLDADCNIFTVLKATTMKSAVAKTPIS